MADQRWALKEHLYSFEDYKAKDCTSIWENRIQKCGSELCFWLPAEDAEGFEVGHDPGGQYRTVEIMVRGNDILYGLMIPRTGKFSARGGHGSNPIRKRGNLKIDRGFSMANIVD